MNHLIPIFIGLSLFVGCTSSGPSAGKLIRKRGTFPSPGGTYDLVIGKKSRSLVDYKIVELSSNQEFAPKHLFSDAMRWAAFWENDSVLWVHSSDIGLSVWKADSAGTFSQCS